MLPCELERVKGGAQEAGTLVTIKWCSAILVKKISMIVTYSGEMLTVPVRLDHQKSMKQRRAHFPQKLKKYE